MITHLSEQLRQISVNCNQLKSLSIDYKLELNDGPNTDHFSSLRQFKRLKRMNLYFTRELYLLFDYLESNQFLPFSQLKGFTELTEITFYCEYNIKLSDTIFTDIDINLPQLQSLTFYGFKVCATHWTLLMLKRMTRLESIHLVLDNKDSISEFSSQLTKNCKKLRKLRLL